MNTKPHWFALIDEWRRRGMGEIGPTLPFVAAAIAMAKRQPVDSSHASLVLDSIVNDPVEGFAVLVVWCHNIEGPVLEIGQIEMIKRIELRIVALSPAGRVSLAFGANLALRWGLSDAQHGRRMLETDAMQALKSGCSRRWHNGEYAYGPFSDRDLTYVRAVTGSSGRS